MARCKFCGKKLDAAGYCTNEKCPESIRAKIIQAAVQEETAAAETTTHTEEA